MITRFVLLLLAAAPGAVVDQLDVGELGPGVSPYPGFAEGKVKAEHLRLHFTAPVTISGVRFKSCVATRAGFWLSLESELVSANDEHASKQSFTIKADTPRKVLELTLEVASEVDGGGGGELCIEHLELLGERGKVLELALQPGLAALAQEVAACERGHSLGPQWEPLRCSVSTPEFQIPGREVVEVAASHHSDGDGSFDFASYLLRTGDTYVPLFKLDSSNSGDGPGNAHTEKLVLCRASSHGVQTFDVVLEDASWGGADDKTQSTQRIEHYVWNGEAFETSTESKQCPLPLVPRPPDWLARASASSELEEPGLAEGYYAASAAADGLAETAWAEGVKGTGVGESLTLTLRAPKALKGLRVLAGCGVNAALWKKNQRVKSLEVSFSDGPGETFTLEDSKPGEWRRLQLARVAPTSSVALKVLAVFPARFQDACISEVELETR